MSETQKAEALEFKTEVQQLLHILSHSLYKEREIFLRELISNASDALHRMQFVMLTDQNVLDPDVELAIRIESDEDAHTLTISDTGVGMTREELVENLGGGLTTSSGSSVWGSTPFLWWPTRSG